jgi:hypothetical protein
LPAAEEVAATPLLPPLVNPSHEKDQVEEGGADDVDSSDDDDSSDEDLGLCPTYAEDAPLPSAGSALHCEGTCKRCCFFPKGRCNNGYDCQFCHFAHEKRKPKNKKKKKKKKRRKNKLTSSSRKNAQSPKPDTTCAPSPVQAKSPQSPSVHQVFGGDSPKWTRPRDRPSHLVCGGLSFVSQTVGGASAAIPGAVLPGHSIIPGAVLPGHSIMTMPMMQQAYTWPLHYESYGCQDYSGHVS